MISPEDSEAVAYSFLKKAANLPFWIRLIIVFPVDALGAVVFYFPKYWERIKYMPEDFDDTPMTFTDEIVEPIGTEAIVGHEVAPMPKFVECDKCDGYGEIMILDEPINDDPE